MSPTLLAWRDWPIARKVALVLVTFAIAPLAGVSLFHAASERQSLLVATQAENLQRARSTSAVLDVYLQEMLVELRLIALLPSATGLLQHPRDENTRAELTLALREAREVVGFDAFYLTDQSGNVLAASEDRFVGRSYLTARWFRAAIAGQTSFDEPRDDPEDEKVYLHFSTPVRTPAGALVGTMIGRVTMSTLDRLLAADADYSGRGDYGVLWDEQGIPLSHGLDPALRFHPLAPLAADVTQASPKRVMARKPTSCSGRRVTTHSSSTVPGCCCTTVRPIRTSPFTPPGSVLSMLRLRRSRPSVGCMPSLVPKRACLPVQTCGNGPAC
jgi:C4-dicarboxylate-specific signal transduction histidine kinase